MYIDVWKVGPVHQADGVNANPEFSIMKKTTLMVSLFLLTQIGVLSQTTGSPILVKTFYKETTLDPIQELAVRLANQRDRSSVRDTMKIGLRLCSAEPMQFAIMSSAWLFPMIMNVFDGAGLEGKNVIILKSKDCALGSSRTSPATEVWVLNETGMLPPYDEKYMRNQIAVKEIGHSSWYAGEPAYLANTRKLIDAMRRDRSAFGVIQGFYIQKTKQKNVQAKLDTILGLLRKSGLPSSRYSIKSIKTTAWVDAREPIYPVMYVVSINPSSVNVP